MLLYLVLPPRFQQSRITNAQLLDAVLELFQQWFSPWEWSCPIHEHKTVYFGVKYL